MLVYIGGSNNLCNAQACNMELEPAVQLYFDTQTGPTPQSDAELAASMQQQQTSTSQPK